MWICNTYGRRKVKHKSLSTLIICLFYVKVLNSKDSTRKPIKLGFKFISLGYLILLVYLIFMQSWVEDSGGGEEERYRNLMLMCSSVGFISSMVFHVLVKDTGKFDLEVFRIILL